MKARWQSRRLCWSKGPPRQSPAPKPDPPLVCVVVVNVEATPNCKSEKGKSGCCTLLHDRCPLGFWVACPSYQVMA